VDNDEPSSRAGIALSAKQLLPGSSVQRWAFVALLLLASVLRLWDLPQIPYTHDEISALIRVYPSLGETVSKGVIELDTHPPGVQVFEWAWTKVFGMDEAAVKLPFILFSLLALFFLYRFTFAWCGGNVALIVTALLATLQYTVMYGQIARPYAAGLFTTALLADQLTRYLGSGSRRTLIGIGVAALLSAYTHHFAMMLAAFMVITVFFLIPSAKRKEYLVACGTAVLLYLPNIPIFLKQFGEKGLDEWLSAPTVTWIPDYLWWIAHCSIFFVAAWALLILGSAALRIRHRGSIGPLWAITLVWGLLPLAIGYAYSVLRAPVLQYSVVIFSFPYLLIGVLAGLRHMRTSWTVPIACATAGLSVFTLVTVRRHYEVFYRSKYEAITRGIIDATKQPDRLALVDAPDRMIAFYLRRWKVDSLNAPYINIHERPAAWTDSVLIATPAASVFYGASPGASSENLPRIQAVFPFLLERHDMDEGQTFLFAKRPTTRPVNDISKQEIITPETVKGEGWQVDKGIPLTHDTTAGPEGRRPTWDFTGKEFGLVFDRPVYELSNGDNDVLEARMEVADAATGSELKLVLELKEGERTVFYRNSSIWPGGKSLIVAVPLSDLPGHGQGQRLKVYLWNPGSKSAHVASLTVQVRAGDPWLYGFFQPLKEPLRFP
jgi:hypothetical protein